MNNRGIPLIESLEPRITLNGSAVAAAAGVHLTPVVPAVSQRPGVVAKAVVGVGGVGAKPQVVMGSDTVLSNSITGVASDGKAQIPYRLFVPALTSRKQKVPLILYLHGLGDGGTDNVSQVFWMSGLQAATASGPDAAFVLAPQLPSGWVFGIKGTTQAEGMNLTMIALQKAMKNPNVDLNRIYVTGVSMGAYGVWDILRRYPKLFAAGVPMSYGGDPSTASTIAHIPIWAFHGSDDPVKPVQATRAMIAALVAAGGTPWYTEIAGAGHYIWNSIYDKPALYAWLFSKHKGRG
jgi:predicted peptidase